MYTVVRSGSMSSITIDYACCTNGIRWGVGPTLMMVRLVAGVPQRPPIGCATIGDQLIVEYQDGYYTIINEEMLKCKNSVLKSCTIENETEQLM